MIATVIIEGALYGFGGVLGAFVGFVLVVGGIYLITNIYLNTK